MIRVLQGDCHAVMQTLDEASIDSIVTDPPYHLTTGKKGGSGAASDNPNSPAGRSRIGTGGGFMGMQWDGGDIAQSVEMWAEALRVLKPGGHLLAFSGTRTYHRMVCAIEDAGFEIRDQIGWLYGSGFPKSRNLDGDWQGWGTALKPAWEPIVVARKPLIGTVAANVLQFGTGAINVDACRVETGESLNGGAYAETSEKGRSGSLGGGVLGATGRAFVQPLGRWPANIIHDGSDEVLAAFPQTTSGDGDRRGAAIGGVFGDYAGDEPEARIFGASSGSAARFFYTAKASAYDRNDGCYDLPSVAAGGMEGRNDGSMGTVTMSRNHHPTVKPTDLMRYLCRLVTPPGGTVLDPFMGSGSTLKAAELEGFNAIGIELDPNYVAIAQRRISSDAPLFASVEVA